MSKSVDKSPRSPKRLALYELLKAEDVYAAEVARHLGCSTSAVSRYLSGERAGLPDGQGERSFRTAVRKIAESKRTRAAGSVA